MKVKKMWTISLITCRIDQIADAPLADVEAALNDPKLAKGFHTGCKSHGKKGTKRAADGPTSPNNKKQKLAPTKYDLDYSSMTPDELEGSLTLPLVEDEELIKNTTIVTNRAPLVLAFAVELLRFTMPEQPPSSRLSLGQAVVSANSRTKAVSIGIEKAAPEIPLSDGQPKVRVMGREIPVLKRGDYTWSEAPSTENDAATKPTQSKPDSSEKRWLASQTLTSRDSTFVAHAIRVSSPAQRPGLINALMEQKPSLETASHNAWAIRSSFGKSPLIQQASFDDGESGCGKFMLELMREANVTNTVVVLTRWFGGTMLGPDRWRLMRECVSDALSAQQRKSSFSGEAVWGLDPQDTKPAMSTVGMAVHRPEGARNYLLRSFMSAPSEGGSDGKKTATAANDEKQENLGRLLGALRLLFQSWASVLRKDELDRRAWSWYVAVRPDVEAGPGGWGAKGKLNLAKILELRREEETRT